MSGKTKYEYAIVRSSRKTLCLEIRAGGGLTVRAPKRASKADIERFVRSKDSWIARNLTLVRPLPPRATPEEEARLRSLAHERLPGLVRHYARIMGVNPTSFRVTGAQKRLGSCSSKGAVCFSYRLMAYPQEVVEYIVVHELAHMKQMNHSPAFYAVVAEVMPDWEERRAVIKRGLQASPKENPAA